MGAEQPTSFEGFEQEAYQLLFKPRISEAFLSRSTVNWELITDIGDDGVAFHFFQTRNSFQVTDVANALFNDGSDLYIASYENGQIHPVAQIKRGNMLARLIERFDLATHNLKYYHHALASDWLLYTSLDEEFALLHKHHTCIELEDNWVSVFTNYQFAKEHTRFINSTNLTWKHPWIPKGSTITSKYPTLVKNPDVRGNGFTPYGNKNGIVPIEIDNTDTIMFACSVTDSGLVIPARPIHEDYRESMYRLYMNAHSANE